MPKPSRSLSELLAISRAASNRNLNNDPVSPVVSCKRTLVLLPLRYGVMSGLDQAMVEKLAPALPPHLGKRLAPELAHSRYAIRSVREGFVYVFVKRMGKDYVCEATYRVHDSGLLQPVLTYEPGTPVGGAHRWFDPRRLDMTLSLFSYLHEYLLKLLPNNVVDRRLLSPMLGFVHAGLGEVTTRIRMSDLAASGQTANPNRVAGQVNAHISRVRDSVMQEFQNSGKGAFYQLRGSALLALLESIILGVKISNKDAGDKEYLEYKAAMLITTAAAVELTAVGVQMIADRYAPTGVVGRGASISLGGLRLVGGSLAMVGGAYMVILDVNEAKLSRRRGLKVLGSV